MNETEEIKYCRVCGTKLKTVVGYRETGEADLRTGLPIRTPYIKDFCSYCDYQERQAREQAEKLQELALKGALLEWLLNG